MPAFTPSGTDARTRTGPGAGRLALLLAPALAVVLLFFGGGLVLGLVQALGYIPGAGLGRLSPVHFTRVLTDPPTIPLSRVPDATKDVPVGYAKLAGELISIRFPSALVHRFSPHPVPPPMFISLYSV